MLKAKKRNIYKYISEDNIPSIYTLKRKGSICKLIVPTMYGIWIHLRCPVLWIYIFWNLNNVILFTVLIKCIHNSTLDPTAFCYCIMYIMLITTQYVDMHARLGEGYITGVPTWSAVGWNRETQQLDMHSIFVARQCYSRSSLYT